MNVLVIGATGQTGHEVLRQLITQGHQVTAFARTPTKVDTHDGVVRIVQGDARDQASLTEALAGQQAVIAAFGPRSFKADDLQATFMKNLVLAMEAKRVNRLVMLSAWGATDSRAQATLLIRILLRTLLKNVAIDKANGERAIMASQIDYTFVRPAILLNTKVRGKDKVAANLSGVGLKLPIARADVATFMIEQLTSDAWHRQSPLIGYPK